MDFSSAATRPFTYTMNSSGPTMDPCGTPQDISLVSDLAILIVYYCRERGSSQPSFFERGAILLVVDSLRFPQLFSFLHNRL